MIAVRGNRTYVIDERECESRREDGFDIYDEDGRLVAYARGKTIAYELHAQEVERLAAERDAARAEAARLSAALKKLKKE